MNSPEPSIWWRGGIVKGDEVALSLANHSLHYGLCVFEGISAWPSGTGHHIFRLGDHLHRFASSCDLVGLQLAHAPDELFAACHDVLLANGLQRAYLRPIAVLGDGVLGLAPEASPAEAAILAFDARAFDVTVRGARVRLTLSPAVRVSADAMPTKAKVSGTYLNSRVAWLDARRRGFDDAILLDQDGYVAECSVQNVFGIRGRRLMIPDSSTALDGITIDSIAQIGRSLGLAVTREQISADDLLRCDALCVASTAAGVRTVDSVDDQQFDPADRVARDLIDAYDRAERGTLGGFEHWLSRHQEAAS